MKSNIWNPKMECMNSKEIKVLQEERFLSVVHWAYKKSIFYKRKFDQAGVSLSDIKSLKDINKLPFIYKDDLRISQENAPPYGEHCVSPDKIYRTFWSTGTTGNPTFMGVSRDEAIYWDDVIARSLYASGLRKGNMFHHATQLSSFGGGYNFLHAAQVIGANIIPAGAGNTERHIFLISKLKPTFMKILPAYAVYMAEVGYKLGVDMRTSSIKNIYLSAEPAPPDMREDIERKWNATTFDNYGLSDLGQPEAYECELHNGLHEIPDWVLTEIIDPETKQPIMENGKEGVLVYTNLVRKAMPIIRFWTNNPSSWKSSEPCECGRTTARIEPVYRRVDDMIKIKGVNFWPGAIWTILKEQQELSGMHRIIIEDRGGKEYLKIILELTNRMDVEKENLISALKSKFQGKLFIKVDEIELVPFGSIEKELHKEKTVIDLRGRKE